MSFEPGSNGLWSVLGWSSYGLDEELLPGSVTLVAACALVDERIPAFQTAIQSWVEASRDGPAGKRSFDRVIIVDWSSKANLWQQVLNFWTVDTPLDYYRVDDPDGNAANWVLAKAFNFGMSRVKTDTVLKVDCDTYVSNGLLGLNPVADKAGEIKAFRYGDYRAAADENEIHINGCVLAKKAVLEAVNFYDERLQQYGWDDTNFYDRLMAADTMALNITRRNALGKTLITHVWHPHSELSQDGRVSSSCENRCAINRLERREPWATRSAPSTGRCPICPTTATRVASTSPSPNTRVETFPACRRRSAARSARCSRRTAETRITPRGNATAGRIGSRATIRRRSWRRTMKCAGRRNNCNDCESAREEKRDDANR